MADSKMKWQVDVSGDLSPLDQMNERVEKLAQSFAASQKASERGAKAAKGSYQALEKELKDNVRELKRVEVGSKAFDKQKAKVAALQQRLAGAKAEMKQGTTAAQKLAAAARGSVAQVAGIAGGMIGVQTAITAVVSELEKAKNLQLKAHQQELTLEAALADIGLNIGGDKVSQARDMIETNAQGLGTTQEGLANLLGVAISAGAKDLEEAMKVSAAALEVTVGDATAAQELAATALDITSLSGSDDFKGALGQVAQVQSQVRSTNAQEFFSNIGPALAAATADRSNIDGITTERTLEMSSVFSQVLKDRTGANTATAVRQFVTRLDTFVPQLSQKMKDGSKTKLTKEDIDAFRGSRSMDERIEMFRGNEDLRKQFLDQQQEGIGKGAISEFISGTDRALEIETKASTAITSLAEANTSYEQLAKGIGDATTFLQADRQAIANLEGHQTGTLEARRTGAARKIMTHTMANINMPGMDQIQAFSANAQFDALGEGDDAIAEVKEFLQTMMTGENNSFYMGDLSKQDAAFVKKQIEVLDQIATNTAAPAEAPTININQPSAGPRPIKPAAAAAP